MLLTSVVRTVPGTAAVYQPVVAKAGAEMVSPVSLRLVAICICQLAMGSMESDLGAGRAGAARRTAAGATQSAITSDLIR